MEVCSQNQEKKFRIGVCGGLNASVFNEEIGEFGANNYSDYKKYVRVSPLIGLIVNLRFTDAVSLQPEILYTLKGGSYRSENSSVFFLGGDGDQKAYYYKNYRLNFGISYFG